MVDLTSFCWLWHSQSADACSSTAENSPQHYSLVEVTFTLSSQMFLSWKQKGKELLTKYRVILFNLFKGLDDNKVILLWRCKVITEAWACEDGPSVLSEQTAWIKPRAKTYNESGKGRELASVNSESIFMMCSRVLWSVSWLQIVQRLISDHTASCFPCQTSFTFSMWAFIWETH